MPLTIQSGAGPTIRPYSSGEFDFNVIGTADDALITSGGSTPVDILDTSVIQHTASTVDSGYELSVELLAVPDEFINDPITFELIGAAGSLSGIRLSRVSNGSVYVTSKIGPLKKNIQLALSRTGGTTYNEFVDFVSGSVAKAAYDETYAMAYGKTSANLPAYTTQNHAAGTYVRNANCWTSSIDLTCVSPWNSYDSIYKAGTLVSPRHTVHAGHFPISIGAVLRFVTQDNTVVTRTVTNTSTLAGGIGVDLQIAVLDSDVPGTISFAKVFPANVLDYFPAFGTWDFPSIAFDQEEKVICRTVTSLSPTSNTFITFHTPVASPFATLGEEILNGDSGNPVFIILNGEPILISHWTSFTGGPTYFKNITGMNAAMTTLGGGYQLTEVDLSGFTDYS